MTTIKKSNNESGLSRSEVGALVASPFGGGRVGAVSIQGYEGSFHQVAAQLFFGKEVEVICCDTFKDVIKIASNKKESDGGVMAIENSIAGSILANYNLLQKSTLIIIGEIYLQIRQNLLVNPGNEDEMRRAGNCLNDVFDLVIRLNGTLSGEHGVGSEKRAYISKEINEPTLDLMREIKRVFDPRNILNPGKLFP